MFEERYVCRRLMTKRIEECRSPISLSSGTVEWLWNLRPGNEAPNAPAQPTKGPQRQATTCPTHYLSLLTKALLSRSCRAPRSRLRAGSRRRSPHGRDPPRLTRSNVRQCTTPSIRHPPGRIQTCRCRGQHPMRPDRIKILRSHMTQIN